MTTIVYDVASDITLGDFLATVASHNGMVDTIDPVNDGAINVSARFPNRLYAEAYLIEIGIDADELDMYFD